MNFFNKKEIEKKYTHTLIIKQIIDSIYFYKIQGIHWNIMDVFHNTDIYKNNNYKIIMTKIISPKNFTENIQIFLTEINFLKTINSKRFVNNFYTSCVECGQIHAQHKYRNCGHSVNYLCAYKKLFKSNCCSKCGKNIKKEEIKSIRTKEQHTCPICLENCETKLESCGHYFHTSCITKYYNTNLCEPNKIEKNNSCPICRKKIVETKKNITIFKNTKFCLDKKRDGYADILIQII